MTSQRNIKRISDVLYPNSSQFNLTFSRKRLDPFIKLVQLLNDCFLKERCPVIRFIMKTWLAETKNVERGVMTSVSELFTTCYSGKTTNIRFRSDRFYLRLDVCYEGPGPNPSSYNGFFGIIAAAAT